MGKKGKGGNRGDFLVVVKDRKNKERLVRAYDASGQKHAKAKACAAMGVSLSNVVEFHKIGGQTWPKHSLIKEEIQSWR